MRDFCICGTEIGKIKLVNCELTKKKGKNRKRDFREVNFIKNDSGY